MKTALILLALAACTDTRKPITGTQSLQVKLVSPADPGSVSSRLPDSARAVSFEITALGPDDQPDTTYNNSLQVYVHFLGTLTPYLGGPPLATVQMAQGKGTLTTTLPPVFGATTVWFDDGSDQSATYATGVSPTLWYRDPAIADIQTPTSETALNALTDSPLEAKNVDVRISRYGANGRLVITSLYAQGYTLADVKCADAMGNPPCKTCVQDPTICAPSPPGYDFIDIFSYSAPLDQQRRFLSEGQVVDGFAGGVGEFDGLTEIGFPQTFAKGDPVIDARREPPPTVLDASGGANDWFMHPINFERNESGAIEIDNAKVCNLDANYVTYKQWEIDPAGVGGDCTNNKRVISIVSNGSTDVDPSTLVGKTMTKVIGILRPINIGSFNVWIIYPRTAADLVQ